MTQRRGEKTKEDRGKDSSNADFPGGPGTTI